MIAFSILLYGVINLILHYAILGSSYSAALAAANEKGVKISSSEYFAFKISYLLKPIEGMRSSMTAMFAVMASMFVVTKFDHIYMIKYGNKDIKGDQHFLSHKELLKECKKLSSDLYYFDAAHPENAKKSGIPIALSQGKMFICPSTTHSLIIGTTRSGKGQTYVNPMIRFIALSHSKHSIVANDPKGELVECEYDILKEQGYDICIFNLRDTNKSSLWNPLQIITDEYVKAMEGNKDLSKVNKLVTSLAATFTDNPKSDPIWPDSAKSLLIAMILLIMERCYAENCLDKVNMYSVYNFFIEFGTYNESVKDTKTGRPKELNALDMIFQNLPLGSPAKSAYSTSNFAKGEMRSSIFSTLASNINIFGSDMGISKLTSANQIDFNRLINPKKPCAIFMVVPDEDTSRHVIASLFVNQCYNYLVEQSSQFRGQKLPQRVHFILDEFGNMVRIPDMDTKITVGAGRELLFDLFVQDLNQLDTKYDNAAKTIRSNTGNVVYINSLDNDTNEYISKLLGQRTMEYNSFSGQLSEGIKSRSIQVEGVNLMTAAELSEMEFGEAVIKRQRKMPIRTKFEPFYKLKIKPKPIDEMGVEIQNVNLDDVIYDFSSLWVETGLEKGKQIAADKGIEIPQQQSKPDKPPAQSKSKDAKVPLKGGAFVNAAKKTDTAKPDKPPAPRRRIKAESKPDINPVEQAIEKANALTDGKLKMAYAHKDYKSCMEMVEDISDKLTRNESECLYKLLSPLYEKYQSAEHTEEEQTPQAEPQQEEVAKSDELAVLLEKVNGLSGNVFINALDVDDYEECYAIIDKLKSIRKIEVDEHKTLMEYINAQMSDEE